MNAGGGENVDSSWPLYLQGEPGMAAPCVDNNHGGWWTCATRAYRVLLLDQRGTGWSVP